MPSSAGDKIIKIKNHDIIGNMGEQLANITIPVDGNKHGITDLRQDIDNEKQLIVINKKVFKGREPFNDIQ
ncbi:MAG: hypothetical protein V3575_04035 [Candidatus Absconditabacteria bacterium]